jgi:AraC family transcriptional regulator
MLSAMTDLVRENGDGGDSAIAELYAKILFLRVESSPPKDEQPDQRRARILIGTLRDKIASGLHKPWSAQLLAEVAGFSTTHLNRLFRTTLGTAPMALVRELRMDRAKELLRRTDYPVAAIAGSVGYADQFAFSAAFKRTVGMNPREYRNSRGRDAAATQRTAAQ